MKRFAVTPFLFCSLLALAAVGCGDDGNGGGDTPDAQEPDRPDAMEIPVPDAGPETPPDAAPPTPELVVSATTLTVNEAGPEGATLTVKLSAAPSAAVEVDVTSSNGGAAVAFPAELSFDANNFGAEQTVTVTAPNDANANNETLTLTISGEGLEAVTVDVTVIDDEALNILANPTTVTVDEGDVAGFDVRLTVQPDADVTVNVVSSAEGTATVDRATLTFTPANYDDPQTVTVSGVSDDDVADEAVSVTLSSDGVADVTVTVNVDDDDTQTIQVSATTVSVTEDSTGTFTVRLSSDPLGSFTVTLNSTDTGAVTTAPTSLTFNSGNYTTPQTVTINGVSDADVNDESVPVRLSGNGVADVTVTVNVDDDTQTIQVSATTVSVTEDSTGTFTVRPSRDPRGSFTVTLNSTDTGAVTTSPTSLTFNSGNYTTPQTVTVNGVSDVDGNNESVPVRLSGSGVADVTVTINVDDDDTPPPFAVNLFVRFQNGGNIPLLYVGNNRYISDTLGLGAGVHYFKIGDANNTAGTTFAASATASLPITPDTPTTLVANNNPDHQILLTVQSGDAFDFELDATSTTSPVLTVIRRR
jgi:hypothetical protein